jgi:hypothetical protein
MTPLFGCLLREYPPPPNKPQRACTLPLVRSPIFFGRSSLTSLSDLFRRGAVPCRTPRDSRSFLKIVFAPTPKSSSGNPKPS